MMNKRVLIWAVGIVALLGLIVTGLVTWRLVVHLRQLATVPEPAPVAVAPPAGGQNSGSANWAPGTFHLQAPDGVHQTSDRSWSIKGGRAFAQVRRLDDDLLELRFVYPLAELLTAETSAALQIRWSLNPDNPLAAQLNLTSEQFDQLHAVSPITDIPVTGAERQQIRALFEAYLANPPASGTEPALPDAVAQLDGKYYDRTMATIGNLATQVQAVFTPEQWTALLPHYGVKRPPR